MISLTMIFCFLKIQILVVQNIMILAGQGMLMIEKTHFFFILETIWFLVSWYNKKQNFISLSTAGTEYIAATSCCIQLLWMRQMLEDYDIFMIL